MGDMNLLHWRLLEIQTILPHKTVGQCGESVSICQMSSYDPLLSVTALRQLACSFHGCCLVQLTVMKMKRVGQTAVRADTQAVEAPVVARDSLCRPLLL